MSTIVHELGHNMGAHHASALACAQGSGPVSLAETAQCSEAEYDDPFDVMGNLSAHLMSTWHRLQIQHIQSTDDAFVGGSQSVALVPTISVGGIRSIRVPRRIQGRPTKDFFALEVRRPSLPFDDFGLGEPIVQGVSIRLVTALARREPSLLLDMTPGSAGGFRDAALVAGASFTDPVSGTQIRADSIDGGQANLRIDLPRPDTTAPQAPQLTGFTTEGATFQVSWAAVEDDEQLSHYEIERDGAVVGRASTESFNHEGLPDGQKHGYRVVAVDAAGNRSVGGQVVGFITPLPVTFPAKLKVQRATIRDGRLDALFSITGRATGSLTIDYQAAGRFQRYVADVGPAREGEKQVRLVAKLNARQSRRKSGILNVSYVGNVLTQPDQLRLRAANGRTRLKRDSLTFSQGRLRVSGKADADVSGIVRLRASYRAAGGRIAVWSGRATIRRGRWSVNQQLPVVAANDPNAYLTMQFTGDLHARGGPYRGEQDGKSLGNL